ncbi:MAG: hypothetical protein K2Q01_03845 [Rickettsiales bacterium]|nr:hypothetical protein [Rickettsiales bacterium]
MSLVAPVIGAAVGLAPSVAEAGVVLGHTANPLWMGAFFGAFGAIDAALRPSFERLFGGGKAAETAAPRSVEAGKAPAISQQVEMEGGVHCCGTKHRDHLATERANPAEQVRGA